MYDHIKGKIIIRAFILKVNLSEEQRAWQKPYFMIRMVLHQV